MCVCVCVQSLSHVRLFGTPWAVALQAPLSMEFSRQESVVGCHFLLQGIFQIQGLNPWLLHLLHWQDDSLPLSRPALAGRFFTTEPPGKPKSMYVDTSNVEV